MAIFLNELILPIGGAKQPSLNKLVFWGPVFNQLQEKHDGVAQLVTDPLGGNSTHCSALRE